MSCEGFARRHFLKTTSAVVLIGGSAGCTGNGGGDDTDVETDEEGDPLTEYLSDARGYDGQLRDMTGRDEVTVENGAGSDGLAFAPAGIRIDTGTTVVWEWTGRGGGHNVASTGDPDFQFSSDRTAEAGHTFSRTFDDSGIALYVCTPHRAQRMKGGIEVV